MADVATVVGASGSYVVQIDNDNDSTTQQFEVNKDGGGPGNELLVVSENGDMTVHGNLGVVGEISKAGTVTVNNTGSGDLLAIQSSGSTKVLVDSNGLGVFTQAGIRVKVVTVDPDGTTSGTIGDVLFYEKTGAPNRYFLCLCVGGTTWKQVELT